MNSLIFPKGSVMLYLLYSEQSSSYDCCELLHCVDLVCCTLIQTSVNCQQLVYLVHVTAFLSTGIKVDSLLNCRNVFIVSKFMD
jgi:hypothetical protein